MTKSSVDSDHAKPAKPERMAATSHHPRTPEGRLFLTSDLENAIADMPHVRAARIMATGDQIDEIHVISTPAIAPKALVRNIETLLLVRFGVRIDHRCLSVVQSLESPILTLSRPLIQAVRQVTVDGSLRMEVELRASTQVAIGRAAIDGPGDELKAVGLALIDAINNFTGQSRLDLRDVALIDMQERQLALVMIRWQGDRADEWFTGTAISTGDALMAVARATLDAVNRKLVRLPLQSAA